MKFDPVLNVTFRSKVVESKFFTLDGEKEVKTPYYARFIENINQLTPMELHYILIRYSDINRKIGELSRFLDTMKD